MFAFDYGVETLADVLGHFVVGLRSEPDGTPLDAFLPADSAGLTYLSVIPVLTFDDRDPMELES